jgi:hypothetical protein
MQDFAALPLLKQLAAQLKTKSLFLHNILQIRDLSFLCEETRGDLYWKFLSEAAQIGEEGVREMTQEAKM